MLVWALILSLLDLGVWKLLLLEPVDSYSLVRLTLEHHWMPVRVLGVLVYLWLVKTVLTKI